MNLEVGDKVKFNRETYVASEFDSPELLEIVAQEIVGTVIIVRDNPSFFPLDIEFPFPSPWKNQNRLMIVRAREAELIPVSDSDQIETLLEPLVKAYSL